MRHYRLGARTKSDLKVHLVWIPKYRKPVLIGEVAIRVRDLAVSSLIFPETIVQFRRKNLFGDKLAGDWEPHK